MGLSVCKIDRAASDFFCDHNEKSIVGVAVSGGSDSVALLLALCKIIPAKNLKAVTVDHGLRSEAASEAEWVSQLCLTMGVDHNTLKVNNLALGPNLQARARNVRYSLLAKWGQNCDVICLGHSQTDVAETFLMRLSRGSGVDGLASMASDWDYQGLSWARPFLGLSREELRHYLKANNQGWCDDPSNDDLKYKRVQIRQSQNQLDQLGLSTSRLAKTANRMSDVREALAFALKNIRPQLLQNDFGDVLLDRIKLAEIPTEFSERILAEALCWVGQQSYRPRNLSLRRAIVTKITRSLHGCVVIPQPDNFLRITREYKFVESEEVSCPAVWDGRYYAPNYGKGYKIKSLGRVGLSACSDWRSVNRPQNALIVSPSIWKGDQLISAPSANFGKKDDVQVLPTPWEL